MADFHPKCPKCATLMEEGHVPDVAHSQVLESSWAPGEAQRRRFFWGIRYDRDELIPMSAYRCPTCGYVELYARAL